MIRYLALSTVIVLAIAVVVAGWTNRDLIRIKIASVYAHVPPKPGTRQTYLPSAAPPLHGDAPWALSALPECLRQISETSGPPAFVMAHVPAGAQPVAPPATLVYADCTISVTGDEAYVTRGPDRFRIPPKVRFYRNATVLALLRAGGGYLELRVYEPPQ